MNWYKLKNTRLCIIQDFIVLELSNLFHSLSLSIYREECCSNNTRSSFHRLPGSIHNRASWNGLYKIVASYTLNFMIGVVPFYSNSLEWLRFIHKTIRSEFDSRFTSINCASSVIYNNVLAAPYVSRSKGCYSIHFLVPNCEPRFFKTHSKGFYPSMILSYSGPIEISEESFENKKLRIWFLHRLHGTCVILGLDRGFG